MAPPRRAMRHGGRASSLLNATALALLLAAAALTTPARAQELCQTLKTCKTATKGECDRTKNACPPCIYLAVGGGYQCFEKTSETNTCPYTGVIYDCAGVNYGSTGKPSSSSSSSTANTTATPSLSSSPSNSTSTTTTADAAATVKSPMVMYAAIGGGALLVIILLVFVVMRRRRRGRNMPKFADSPQVFNTKRGAKNATANTPYSNMPNTSKGPGQYQRKYSDPVLLESSAVMMGAHQASSDYSGNTATDSLDGMLAMDNTPPPAVLGDPLPRTRSKRGFSSGFKRHNSGGSSKRNSSTYDMQAPPVKAGPNVFGEYLKMKQEFDDDGMSDYGSDMMSLDRFSVTSSSTVGGGQGHGHGGHNVLAMSITDSEYQADLMRSRTESECFSEMSYNDEKYSFSDDTDSVLAASIVRQPPKKDKEVEI